MSDVKELFEMTTRQIEPEQDAWQHQQRFRRRRGAQRKYVAILAAAALTIATAIVVVKVFDSSLAPRSEPAGGGTPPTAKIAVPGNPSGIAEAGGSIWVSTYDGYVYRIDPATNRIVDMVDTRQPDACGDLVVANGSLWVSGCASWGPPDGTTQIDAATGKIVGRWGDPTDPNHSLDSPVFGGGKAWAFNGGAGPSVREVDPATGRIVQLLHKPYGFALGYAFNSLWVVENGSTIVRVDPNTGESIGSYTLPARMDAFTIHGKIGAFASAGGYVWVVAYPGTPYAPHVTHAALFRLDPTSSDVRRMLSITLDPSMSADSLGPEVYLDSSNDIVWVAKTPNSVVGIDARSGRVVGSYAAPGRGATNVAATNDSLWIANYGDHSVWRYDLPQT